MQFNTFNLCPPQRLNDSMQAVSSIANLTFPLAFYLLSGFSWSHLLLSLCLWLKQNSYKHCLFLGYLCYQVPFYHQKYDCVMIYVIIMFEATIENNSPSGTIVLQNFPEDTLFSIKTQLNKPFFFFLVHHCCFSDGPKLMHSQRCWLL